MVEWWFNGGGEGCVMQPGCLAACEIENKEHGKSDYLVMREKNEHVSTKKPVTTTLEYL